MALTSNVVWEVQTGGSDSNGGGFAPDTGNMISDFTATSATGNSPVVSSATYNFVAGDVGHWLYIQGGTNWTPGWYKIASVASNQATLDASVGAAIQTFGPLGTIVASKPPGRANVTAGCATTASPTSGTGAVDYSQSTSIASGTATSSATTLTATTSIFTKAMVGNLVTNGSTWFTITAYTSATVVTLDASPTWSSQSIKVGGPLLTIQKALDLDTIAGMTVFIKSGTYSISSNLSTANFPSSNYGTINRVIGYNTTRGDLGSGGRPVIQTTAAVNGLTSTKDGLGLENLDFYGNSTGTKGISIGGSYHCYAFNCLFRNFTSNGADIAAGTARQCEAKSNGGVGLALTNSSGSAQAQFCYVHDNTSYGISLGVGCSAVSCIAADNSHGFYSNYGGSLYGCIGYSNTNAGFYSQSYAMHSIITNCIFVDNGTYGITLTGTTPVRDDVRLAYNAYYNNTSGARNNGNAGTGDVTLTGNPFTNAAAGDFSLNNTAGAGAACRAVGFPGAFPAGLTTGYIDIGAAQHQDAGGGGGGAATLINGGLVG